MKSRGVCLFVLVSILLVGCRTADEQPPVERSVFVRAYAEMQMLESAHRQRMLLAPRDANFKALRDSVLEKYQLSDSAFATTYRYWYGRPAELSELLDEVIAQVDSMEIQADRIRK
jgi:hypothetical protein